MCEEDTTPTSAEDEQIGQNELGAEVETPASGDEALIDEVETPAAEGAVLAGEAESPSEEGETQSEMLVGVQSASNA